MARITNIANMDRLANAVGRCKGDVFLRLPDQTSFNLKQNREVLQLLRYMQPTQGAVELDLANKSDLEIIIQYMMESCIA